jgi:hypothetical protein
MSIHYPDPDHPDAEILLNNAVAWRRFPDGTEQDLAEAEQEAWYQRLHAELEASDALPPKP